MRLRKPGLRGTLYFQVHGFERLLTRWLKQDPAFAFQRPAVREVLGAQIAGGLKCGIVREVSGRIWFINFLSVRMCASDMNQRKH